MPTPAWVPASDNVQVLIPNQNPSISPINLSGTQLSNICDPNGDFEIEIDITPLFNLSGNASSLCYFQGFSTDGELSVVYVPGNNAGNVENDTGTFTFTVRGVSIGAGLVVNPSIFNILGWSSGQRILLHTWYKPSLANSATRDSAGMRIEVQGCANDGPVSNYNLQTTTNCSVAQASGSPLATTYSSFSIGSKTDGTLPINGTVNQVRFIITGSAYRLRNAYLLVVGDSVMTAYESWGPTMAYATARTGNNTFQTLPLISMIAHPGDKCQDQINAFQYSRYGGFGTAGPGNLGIGSAANTTGTLFGPADPEIIAIIDCCGINNVIGGSTAATIIAAMQALITAVKAGLPNAKYIKSLLHPCAGSMTGPQQAVWQTLNGTGANGITSTLTGVDAFVTNFVAPMSDNPSWVQGNAAPNLNPIYQSIQIQPNQFDKLHPNGSGRQIWADSIVATLQSLGVWLG